MPTTINYKPGDIVGYTGNIIIQDGTHIQPAFYIEKQLVCLVECTTWSFNIIAAWKIKSLKQIL